MRSQIFSVGSDLFWRVIRKWRHASIPSLWGMLVYVGEETSSVTRMTLSGRGPRFCNWSVDGRRRVSQHLHYLLKVNPPNHQVYS